MRFLLASTALLAFTTGILAAAVNDDTYSNRIDIPVSANASDGANAIARFLGFKCPKGHRCLPVLECLPCDYGTYKADEGSDLCERCPGGCTTLRKGAESKKECVPKCPPGYEESECGKTCTKCRAGFYKSTWKNKPCSSCPSTSSWDPNLVGMTKRMQCDAEDPVPTSTPTPGGDMCTQKYGSCTQDDYENTRLRLLEGSRCKQFCHCAHQSTSASGSVDYYWEEQTCAAGTLFDESLQTPVCNHENLVKCSDTACPAFDVDIIFALDNSGSLSEDDFNTLVDGVNTFIHSFVVSATGPTARFGVVTFGNVQETIYLNTFTDKEKLKQAIAQLKYGGGLSDIGKAVTLATKLLNTTYGNRKNVPDIGIVITASDLPNGSGGSSASVLKSLLSKVFAVGIGLSDSSDLYSIASHDDYVVETSDINDLINRLPELTSDACVLIRPSISTTSMPTSVPDRCKVKYGVCEQFDYEVTRLIALPGTDCKMFCQCAHAQTLQNGSVTYYWEEHACAAGTLFDESLPSPGCNHDYAVKCNGSVSSTPSPGSTSKPSTTTAPRPPVGCVPNSRCDDHDYAVKRLMPLYGTKCTQFCQCTYNAWSSGSDVDYYWQEMTCSAGTLFDTSLQVPLCNHANLVICPELTTTTTRPTPPTPDNCTPGAACTAYEENMYVTIPRLGTACRGYCECRGLVWVEKWCDASLMYDPTLFIPACNWKNLVHCSTSNSTGTSNATVVVPPPPTAPPLPEDLSVPMGGSCTPGDTCTEYENAVKRILTHYGTNCTQFCQCEENILNNGDAVYTWELQSCPQQTILDLNLPSPNCNRISTATCVECPDTTADIIFVLDSSGSVGSDNFDLVLNFVTEIIQVFDVSSDVKSARFAAITYGDSVYEYIPLNKYTDKTKLLKAVANIQYLAGYTYTNLALDFVQTTILASSTNRPNATDIVIVITDGKSTVPSSTSNSARKLKQVANIVLAVGIGNADVTELNTIATSSQYVHFIDTFDALNQLKNKLRQDTCGGSNMYTTPMPTSISSNSTKDTTNSTTTVYNSTTTTPSTTVSTTVATLPPTTPDGCPTTNCSIVYLIAMAVTNCTKYCQCNTATGHWVLNQACPVGTRFNNMLQTCDWQDAVDPKTCLPSSSYDPTDPPLPSPSTLTSATSTTTAPDISMDYCTPNASCTAYEESNARTIPWPGTSCRGYCECKRSVWVGRWCDPDQAYDPDLYIPSCNWDDMVQCNEDPTVPIVTQPPSVTITPDLSVPEYGTCTPGDVCKSYEHSVKRIISYFGTNCTQYCLCEETVQKNGNKTYKWQLQRCPTQTILDQNLPTPNCNWGFATSCVECPDATADIVFVFDSSGSVGSTNFAKMLEFANQIIQVFDVSPNNASTRFAAVTYGDKVYQYFGLSTYTNKTALQDKVKKLTYYAGYTYTDQALYFVQSTILASSSNRPGATDIVIVITDGKSTVPSLTKIYADRLKQTGAKVLAVGIVNADQAELEYIASSQQNVYTIDNFDALRRLKNELRQDTCGGSGSQTVSTSTTLSLKTSTDTVQTTVATTKTSSQSTTGTMTTLQSVTKDGCPASSCSSNYRVAMSGTGCAKYCQCDPATSTWVPRLSCGTGTLFNHLLQACDWDYNVDTTTCGPHLS